MSARHQVESSSIASVGYSRAQEQLEIEFQSGSLYCYFEVPQAVYEDLRGAESVGRYFNAYVRPHYSYARLHEPLAAKKPRSLGQNPNFTL